MLMSDAEGRKKEASMVLQTTHVVLWSSVCVCVCVTSTMSS